MRKTEEPLQVGALTLGGRIVMPPIATYRCDEETGHVTDDVVDYYAQRAANPNVSLIVTEHAYICKAGQAKAGQMSIADDSCVDGLSRLVDAIHAGGALAFAQLNHAGSAALREVVGCDPVAPSAVALPPIARMGDDANPAELSEDEITRIVECFVQAARRAKEAGYDGVEVHSAHAYLLNQFLSPLTNRRTDGYGGSLENRMHIHREVLAAVREQVGESYPVSVRLGGCDYMENGLTIEEGVAAAKILEEAGAGLLSVTGGMCRYTVKGRKEPGWFKDLSTPIRDAVNVPVLLTGGVKAIDQVEDLLDEGAADLIGVGRKLLADPNWEANFSTNAFQSLP